MTARALALLLALGSTACSLVYDPGAHQGNAPPAGDAGAPPDARPRDADRPDAGLPDAGPPAPIPAADFCGELVAVHCRLRLDCCVAAAGESYDRCRADNLASCAVTFGAWANDRRTGYSPALARTVIEELRAFGPTCDADIVDYLADRSGALRVYEGTFPEGANCNALSVEALACADGNICRSPGVLWSCHPPLAAMATCNTDGECADRLFCDETLDPRVRMGQCAARLPDASPCDRAQQCASLLCAGAEGSRTCATRTQDVYCETPFSD